MLGSLLATGAVGQSYSARQESLGDQRASAGNSDRATAWFMGKERGWHFYEITPEEEFDEELELPPVPPPLPPPSEVKQEPPQKQTTPGPAPFSVKWIKENIERMRDEAIDDPSPENVSAYLYAQRVMLDKASHFTETFRKVSTTDPVLDEGVRSPGQTFGVQAAATWAARSKRAIFDSLKKKVGLWFFFESTCQYCALQAPLLESIAKEEGIKIMAISLDGRPLPNGVFRNFVTDQGQAASLGIEITPAVVAVRPPNGMAIVGQGLMARDEVVSRVIEASYNAGWIEEKDWERTKVQRGTLVPTSITQEAANKPEVISNPKDMVAFIRSKLKPGKFE